MKVWKVSPWYKAESWDYCKENGVIYFGDFRIPEIRDLNQYNPNEIIDIIENKYPKNKGFKNQLLLLYENANIGDTLIAYSNKQIWGIGKLSGKYYFSENHKWPVKWAVLDNPLNVSNDIRLYGNPKDSYGILNRQLAVIQINEDDWNYILNTYPIILSKFEELSDL